MNTSDRVNVSDHLPVGDMHSLYQEGDQHNLQVTTICIQQNRIFQV